MNENIRNNNGSGKLGDKFFFSTNSSLPPPPILAEIPRTTRTYEFYRLVFPRGAVPRTQEHPRGGEKEEGKKKEKKEEEFE